MSSEYKSSFKIYGILYGIYLTLWLCIFLFALYAHTAYHTDEFTVVAAFVIPLFGIPIPLIFGLITQVFWVYISRGKKQTSTLDNKPSSLKKMILSALLFGIVPLLCVITPAAAFVMYAKYNDYSYQREFEAFQEATINITDASVDFDGFEDMSLMLTVNSDKKVEHVYMSQSLVYKSYDKKYTVSYNSNYHAALQLGTSEQILPAGYLKVPCDANKSGSFYIEYEISGSTLANNKGEAEKVISGSILVDDLQLYDFEECK